MARVAARAIAVYEANLGNRTKEIRGKRSICRPPITSELWVRSGIAKGKEFSRAQAPPREIAVERRFGWTPEGQLKRVLVNLRRRPIDQRLGIFTGPSQRRAHHSRCPD
jgi:hypothetical protein